MSAGRIVTGVARGRSGTAEATYIGADAEAITVTFDRIDPARVVRGWPVRDVRSRAGQRGPRENSGTYWSARKAATSSTIVSQRPEVPAD